MDQPAVAQPDALLEREREVERVRAALRAVGRRAGRALIIEGAAGMGKSRLLDEARRQAPGLGVCVLSARATELEQGFPFGVMRQLFERRLLEAGTGERDELYPEVVDACEEEGGVPSRLLKTEAGDGRQEGTPWRMFAGSPSGRTTRAGSRSMISLVRALAG
jgi:hypothetical protein